jgi:hypothetical protein
VYWLCSVIVRLWRGHATIIGRGHRHPDFRVRRDGTREGHAVRVRQASRESPGSRRLVTRFPKRGINDNCYVQYSSFSILYLKHQFRRSSCVNILQKNPHFPFNQPALPSRRLPSSVILGSAPTPAPRATPSARDGQIRNRREPPTSIYTSSQPQISRWRWSRGQRLLGSRSGGDGEGSMTTTMGMGPTSFSRSSSPSCSSSARTVTTSPPLHPPSQVHRHPRGRGDGAEAAQLVLPQGVVRANVGPSASSLGPSHQPSALSPTLLSRMSLAPSSPSPPTPCWTTCNEHHKLRVRGS